MSSIERWQTCGVLNNESREPAKPVPEGCFALGPWEPFAALTMHSAGWMVLWRRPLALSPITALIGGMNEHQEG